METICDHGALTNDNKNTKLLMDVIILKCTIMHVITAYSSSTFNDNVNYPSDIIWGPHAFDRLHAGWGHS